MEVRLEAVTPDAEKLIVKIARVSSKREDKQAEPERLINYLIKNKHWSPFEHGFMTLEITTSKAIGIQLLRHRSFTFQEFSQRYAVVENMEPVELRQQAVNNRQSSTDELDPEIETEWGTYNASELVQLHVERTSNVYKKLLEAGVARECARMVLPMTTQTRMYMSGPVRSWIHLIQLRDDPHAQKEAQLIAREMKKIFKEQFPIISRALEWQEPTEE